MKLIKEKIITAKINFTNKQNFLCIRYRCIKLVTLTSLKKSGLPVVYDADHAVSTGEQGGHVGSLAIKKTGNKKLVKQNVKPTHANHYM